MLDDRYSMTKNYHHCCHHLVRGRPRTMLPFLLSPLPHRNNPILHFKKAREPYLKGKVYVNKIWKKVKRKVGKRKAGQEWILNPLIFLGGESLTIRILFFLIQRAGKTFTQFLLSPWPAVACLAVHTDVFRHLSKVELRNN